MSACEKCWRDAHRGPYCDVAEEYRKLRIARTGDKECSPEEQAGPDGKFCERCGLYSLHQVTGECMNPLHHVPVRNHIT